jgi:hypothetical protein
MPRTRRRCDFRAQSGILPLGRNVVGRRESSLGSAPMPALDPDAIAKKLGRDDLVGLAKKPEVALAEAKEMIAEAAKAKWYRARNDECWPIFLGLVRSKTPIDAALATLLPVPTHADHRKASEECLAAIPEPDRVAAMVHALGARSQLYGGLVIGGLLWLE